MKTQVIWLTHHALIAESRGYGPDISRALHSPLASARLRIGLPAQSLEQLDCDNLLFTVDRAGPMPAIPGTEGQRIIVLTKFLYPPERSGNQPSASEMVGRWLAFVQTQRALGAKIVADVCENPFRQNAGPVQKHAAEFISSVANLTDAFVANSDVMAAHLRERFHTPVRVIPDPVEGNPGTARFITRTPIRLLWFGHSTNLPYLEPWIPKLWEYSLKRAVQLTLVTNPDAIAASAIKDLDARVRPRMLLKLRPWSLSDMQNCFEHADLVIIPSDPDDPRKNGVSSNRLAAALWAGRFPIASPLDSYQALGDYCWLGDNLLDGIEWALTHPEDVVERLQAATPVIASRLSTQAVGKAWRALFSELQAGLACKNTDSNLTTGMPT